MPDFASLSRLLASAPAVFETQLHSLPLLARGKVRDNYAVGDDRILMVSFFQHPFYPEGGSQSNAANLLNVPVPAYTTNTVADHAHILRDAGIRAAIVSTAALAGRVREAAAAAGGRCCSAGLPRRGAPARTSAGGAAQPGGAVAAG